MIEIFRFVNVNHALCILLMQKSGHPAPSLRRPCAAPALESEAISGRNARGGGVSVCRSRI